ncbi:MAG: putative RND superfamily exporter protein [Chlamydiales bacterium]|jgi:predicted RND superfamily exporter protein
MKIFADLVVNRPRAVVLGLALLTALALLGASQLAIDDVPRSFFRSEDEDYERLEQVFRDFGSDDDECLVLFEADDIFSPDAVARIVALDEGLRSVAGVRDVLSLDDVLVFDRGLLPRRLLPAPDATAEAFERARVLARAHPLVEGQILSHDQKSTLLVVRLEGDLQAISAIRPVVDDIQAYLAEQRATGASIGLTGIPPIRVVIFESISREQTLFSVIGAVLGFLIGWFVFRRLGPILITSCASIMAGVWALGCFHLAGQSINILNSALPLLIMVIALTDAAHLMIDILRSRHAGMSVREAARGAVRHLGLPCALTSLTTAIGFGSLALSRVDVIKNFGILFAMAVGLSFLVVLSTIPALSILFLRAGPKTGFDSRPGRPTRLGRQAERLIRAAVRHARAVSIGGAVVTLALLGLALRLTPDNRLTEATPRNSESVKVLRACEEAFGGVLTTSVLCQWPQDRAADAGTFAAIRTVQQVFDEHPFFHGSLSVLNLMALSPDGSPNADLLALLPPDLVQRTWRPDLHRALVSARAPDRPSLEANAAYTALDRALDAVREDYPELEMHVTGTDTIARRNVNVMISDFTLGLGLAALVIFGVLSAAFRSLRLGLISVLPNAFPLVVAASVLAISGLELQMTSVIAFTVCLGLAVDDTIHLVARFQRDLATLGDPTEAAVQATIHVGRALMVTTAILLGGFGALRFSQIPTTQLFAQICCIGLIAALIGDLLFLPALLVTFTPKRVREQG